MLRFFDIVEDPLPALPGDGRDDADGLGLLFAGAGLLAGRLLEATGFRLACTCCICALRS